MEASPAKQAKIELVRWKVIERSFCNRMVTGAIENVGDIKDEKNFLHECEDIFVREVTSALRANPLKVNACLQAKYLLPKTVETEVKYFVTKSARVLESTKLIEWYVERIVNRITEKMSEFQERDSGWTLQSIEQLNVNINKCESFNGGGFNELPREIVNKRAVVNVQEPGHHCFAWAVVSALRPAKNNVNRISSYPNYSTILNLEGLSFPMDINEIPKFEKLNNLSVNVYGVKSSGEDWCETSDSNSTIPKTESKCYVVPIRIANDVKDTHINLLMIRNSPNTYHYCWIKDLSRLVGASLSKRRSKKWICDRCLSYFYTKEKLEAHSIDCKNFGAAKSVMPTENNKWIEFKNFGRKERVPFVVYADLECCVTPVSTPERDPETEKPFTEAVQHHIPCSIAYYFVCDFDRSKCKFDLYRGPTCTEWFACQLNEIARDVESYYDQPVSMRPMTTDENMDYARTTRCHICARALDDAADNPKVRDHCHFTGKFRGAAHSKCNLNYKDKRVIPVVFHNLSGYDSHFIIKDLCEQVLETEDSTITMNPGPMSVIAINKEKYKSFTKSFRYKNQRQGHFKHENSVKLRFIDSMNFMSSSLAELASYLSTASLKHMSEQFLELSPEKFELLVRKGVYPYDYMDCATRFREERLPSIDKFYSKLTGKDISSEDYEHALRVWQSFECKNLGEYSDLYLKTDVMLLCDVFENFRDVCLDVYHLDAAHYITAPSLAWDAMLKVTEVKLELLTDIDMLLFFERGIRGGLSQCSNRYARANNKYTSDFKADEESSYLMYYDVNNLYGWAMLQRLPTSNFKWIDPREFENFNATNVSDQSSTGYVLEVDLEYPSELHDTHSDLPLCPETLTPPGTKNVKLLATLYNKHRYVIHYRNLKLSLSLGLRLTKIHRILSFDQSSWMSAYIDLNTRKRTLATNDFEKNFFKLMNNSVFGKTMQNVRKMRDIKLVTRWEGRYGAGRLISKPNFRDRVIFDENFSAIEMNRVEITFDKPIYIGMCILDISKIQLYKFHYDYILTKYADRARLLYTDTDSLIYHIKTEDVYKDIRQDAQEWFDTSDYASDNPYAIPRLNKKVVGMMKDENKGQIMTKFAGLRSKMYAFEIASGECKNKAKGVKYSAARILAFSDYEECLSSGQKQSRHQHSIRSHKHQVYTLLQYKTALCPRDDKRVLIEDSTNTYPWGHYKVNQSN